MQMRGEAEARATALEREEAALTSRAEQLAASTAELGRRSAALSDGGPPPVNSKDLFKPLLNCKDRVETPFEW